MHPCLLIVFLVLVFHLPFVDDKPCSLVWESNICNTEECGFPSLPKHFARALDAHADTHFAACALDPCAEKKMLIDDGDDPELLQKAEMLQDAFARSLLFMFLAHPCHRCLSYAYVSQISQRLDIQCAC
jgi:hypothetical protein